MPISFLTDRFWKDVPQHKFVPSKASYGVLDQKDAFAT
jgi:hypothetical protein